MSEVTIKTRICDQHVYVISKVGDKPVGNVLVSMNAPFLAARLRWAAARLRKRHAAIEAITDGLPEEAEGDEG